MDLQGIIQLTAQIPIVGIFIWFTLKMMAMYQKQYTELHDAQLQEMTRRDMAYLAALEKITMRLEEHERQTAERHVEAMMTFQAATRKRS